MVVKSVHQWHLSKKDSVMSELPMAECGSNLIQVFVELDLGWSGKMITVYVELQDQWNGPYFFS